MGHQWAQASGVGLAHVRVNKQWDNRLTLWGYMYT